MLADKQMSRCDVIVVRYLFVYRSSITANHSSHVLVNMPTLRRLAIFRRGV